MSYVICANLVIFVYLILALTLSVETVANRNSLRRFLELHLLWPCPEKLLVENTPSGFRFDTRDLITQEQYDEAVEDYSRKHHIDRETLEKEHLRVSQFSITRELGNSISNAIENFQKSRFPLTISFFIILGLAYVVLAINIKTNLAESVSPLIWGNRPLDHRSSELMKILWMIPPWTTIEKGLRLFFMLPFLVAVAILLLFACHNLVDSWMAPYTFLNNTFTVIVSLVITGSLFTVLYILHVTDVSKSYAAIGAFVASALWLGGRWFFTTYGAVSIYLNLRNFAFVPIALTWFYYFCAVFLFGIYVAHTLETPELSTMARFWEMRDITIHSRYTALSQWVRLDFLYRLAKNRHDEDPPPFIGINVKGDSADDIARHSRLSPPFVRECLLNMLAYHPDFFNVEVEGNRQYCRLRLPPEEVDVIPLITDCQDASRILKEMEGYDFGSFILAQYGPFWKAPSLMLSDVYSSCKSFEHKQRPSPADWKKQGETEEIFL